jgi:uncharacterized repeat protein (TIGR02543 family)
LTKTGHTFLGWATSADATEALTEYTLTADVTFYAVWEINQYTASFDLNEGTGTAPGNIVEDYNTPITFPEQGDLTKTGHTFLGWATSADATEALTEYTLTADVTFYAVWEINQYTITFGEDIIVKDGETPITTGDEVAYGTELTVTADPKDMHTPVLLATVGNIGENGAYTVVGDVQFTVYYTTNIDELEDIITEEDKPRVKISEDVAEQVINNDNFKKLGTKTLIIDVVDDEGQVLYSWTFKGDYDETKDGTFKASIVAEEPEGDLKDAIDSANLKNSLVLNFAAEGTLPMKATVKYYVGDKFDEGATLTLFFYNADEKALEETESNLTVDKDGYVSFSPPHFSQYVLAESEEDDEAGSNALLYTGIVIAIVVIALIAVFAIRRQ